MSIQGLARKVLPVVMLFVASCAAVDQFGGRIFDGNKNSDLAQNQETLVNIVRASRLQPLNFIAITQVSGGQTETLNTGLPTVTFGPLQTVAQHQFQVTNSVQSGVSGGYQSQPLVSTAFSTGMLSPVDLKTLAFFVGAYPREPVLFSAVESISIHRKATGETIRFVNDPSRDQDASCVDLIGHVEGKHFAQAEKCSFSLFVNVLGVLSNAGLTLELMKPDAGDKKAGSAKGGKKGGASAAADKKGGSSGGADKKGAASDTAPASYRGRFCFDPTRALKKPFKPLCGDTSTTTDLVYRFDEIGEVELTLGIRSPIGVFNYYGRLLNNQPAQWKSFYFTYQARNLVGDEPFLNIVRDAPGPCFASISYAGGFFCAPEGSRHTALLLTMLLHLRNLNIQPSDLNSAFTVRLAN